MTTNSRANSFEPHADDYRRHDRLGRGKPHLIGTPLAWLLVVPGGAERVREVPARAIAEERETEVLLDCPCGAHPVIERPDGPANLQKCGGCERYYLLHGYRLFVAYGAMPVPERQSPN